MSNFQTIHDLRSERQRLHLKKELLEGEIKQDFDALKESLKPINLLKELVQPESHKLNGTEMSPVALNLLGTVLDFTISKVFLRKSSFMKKMVSSYLVHSAGPSIIQNAAPGVIILIKNIFATFRSKRPHNVIYDQSTEGNKY
jgi:hypothetical protein